MRTQIVDWKRYKVKAEDEYRNPVVLVFEIKHQGDTTPLAMEHGTLVQVSVEEDQ